jgi:hypothetical protein
MSQILQIECSHLKNYCVICKNTLILWCLKYMIQVFTLILSKKKNCLYVVGALLHF